jgi:flagellin FlaB
MFNDINTTDDRERGQVGIGTLIVFIALVLVAAIAAGVLINTAGFLQNQAESTGQESTNQVTQSLNVQSQLGTVTSSGTVDEIELTVAKSPGSGPINVTKSTIQYVSPYGAETLVGDVQGDITAGTSTAFYVESNDVLQDSTSPIDIHILLSDSAPTAAMEDLEPGDEVELTIVTPSGGQSTVVATVPQPLTADDNDNVRL